MKLLPRVAAVSVLTVALSTLSPVGATTSQAPTIATAAAATSGPVASGDKDRAGRTDGKNQGKKKKQRKPGALQYYRPPAGVLFNNPYGGRRNTFAISRHILRSVNSVPKGEKIRIATWNLRSTGVTDALIRAHRRGVSVRIVMDQLNASASNPNPDVARVRAAFRAYGNKKRRPSMRSFLQLCTSSCRGGTGIAHSKYYLFSKVAKDRNVVIFGSHNLTELAATIQWNDVYTIKNRKDVYNAFDKVFTESVPDRRVKQPFRSYTFGPKLRVDFYPQAGPKAPKGDPAMRWLRKVRCVGATGGTGRNGRTVIRIGQTAMHGPRGTALAKQLASMKRAGCDIRVVYAMFANDVVRILHGAGIPLVHLAQDFDRDGSYDRYIHMKALAISGVYGNDTSAHIVFNGAANWSPFALDSDEEVGVLRYPYVVNRYIRWIDGLRRPSSWGPDYDTPLARRQVDGRFTEVQPPMRLDGEVS